MAAVERIIGTVDAGSHPVLEVLFIGETLWLRSAESHEKRVRIDPPAIQILTDLLWQAKAVADKG